MVHGVTLAPGRAPVQSRRISNCTSALSRGHWCSLTWGC